MKHKFVIFSLIFVGIGAVLIGIGCMFGGKVYGIGIGRGGVNVKTEETIVTEVITEERDLSEFSSLQMDIAFADVEIVESDRFAISYRVQKDRDIIEDVQGDVLNLRQKNPMQNVIGLSLGDWSFHNVSENYYVKVMVPKGEEFKDISISVDSGDITLGEVKAESLVLDGSFGNVTIDKADSGSVDIQLDSGNTTAKEMIADDLYVKGSFGDIEIDKLVCKENELKLDSGSIMLGNVEGDNVNLDTSFGDIQIDDIIASKQLICNAESGHIELGNADAADITVTGSFGGVSGQKVNASKCFTCNYESGDLDVKEFSGKEANITLSFGSASVGYAGDFATCAVKANTEFGEVYVNGDEVGTEYVQTTSEEICKLTFAIDSGDVNLDTVPTE